MQQRSHQGRGKAQQARAPWRAVAAARPPKPPGLDQAAVATTRPHERGRPHTGSRASRRWEWEAGEDWESEITGQGPLPLSWTRRCCVLRIEHNAHANRMVRLNRWIHRRRRKLMVRAIYKTKRIQSHVTEISFSQITKRCTGEFYRS